MQGSKTKEVKKEQLNTDVLASINGAVTVLRHYPERERQLQLVATLNSGKGEALCCSIRILLLLQSKV